MADLAAEAFYFDASLPPIDWQGAQAVAAVNPEWRRRSGTNIDAEVRALPDLAGHYWVATSGSSSTVPGHVRWVALSKAAFLASAAAVNAHLQSTRADVWAHALPVFHVGGLGILARAWLSGAGVEAAIEGRWDAWRFHSRLLEMRATLTALVPSQLHDLVGARLHAPAALRAIVVGGARLDPELCADARSLGWRCLPSYGLTETCSQVATASLSAGVSRDCSGPLPILAHAEIRADDDHRLHIRASSLLTCYAEMAETGMRAWDPKEDGWLPTEDLGHVTPAGVEVLGRATDSVKVLGEMVSVPRVEAAVGQWLRSLAPSEREGVDMAVVALEHPRLGHELVVVLAGSDADRFASLLAFCRGVLLPYELPHRVARVDRIPRTALGKCQRALLAQEVRLQPRADG